ncbi:MAG: threonine aldolase family protein [Thermodesulfobacteriota bacterium]
METDMKKGFASDNNSGVHPEVLKALADVNAGHTVAYGDDVYTEAAQRAFRKVFGEEVEAHFVFTGTGANVLSLQALTESHHAVICAKTAHINEDECGAPEKFTGCKLLTVPTEDGRITADQVRPFLHSIGFEHHAQPAVISLTQATELGTVYRPEEIREITGFAHDHGMRVHMDGARICNAAAALDLPLRAVTGDVGIDVLSFGGTKNGLMYGEAVLFFDPALAKTFKYIRKQGMQLASKMRFMAAQFLAFFEDDLWLRSARHANRMARLLADRVSGVPGVHVSRKVEANGVFAVLPREAIPVLQSAFFFHVWDEEKPEVRWMTSFDTTEEEIEEFASLLEKTLS